MLSRLFVAALAVASGGSNFVVNSQNVNEMPETDPRHEVHPPSHVPRNEVNPHEDPNHDHPQKEHLLRDHEAHHALGQRPHEDGSKPIRDAPSHVGRRHSRPRKRKTNHRKGDGSKPSHAYDYIFDETEELREELIDTEDTFGHESDEVHEIMSKIRTLEQIQRDAKMLNQGMPQEDFDALVGDITRLAELRLFEHVNGPGSLTKRREREKLGHPDPDDPDTLGYGDQHDEEYEAAKQERSQEMMELGDRIRDAEHHWRFIPKPMTHDASAEQRKEIHELYQSLHEVSNKDERMAIREKMEHVQHTIHDRRRHKDMTDEDRQSIKELRAEALAATDEDEKREIREEIEDLYREHRKKQRAERPHGPPGHARPQKNYHDEDDELKELHDELHQEDDKEGRKAIRAKIRDRLTYLRENDPDIPDHQKPGYGHDDNGGRRGRRSRGSDKLPKSKTSQTDHPRPYADTDPDHPKAPGNDSPSAPLRKTRPRSPDMRPTPPEQKPARTARAKRKREAELAARAAAQAEASSDDQS